MLTKFAFVLLLLGFLAMCCEAQQNSTNTTTTEETTTTPPTSKTELVRNFVRLVQTLIIKLAEDVKQLSAVDNSNINVIA